MNLAPICLFTYNRLHETMQTVEALQANYLAKESELIIFSDGGKNEVAQKKVDAVRQYLKTITGFKTIEIIESTTNKGLKRSIIDGVTAIVNKFGRIIVLEDDIVVSNVFLNYMNSGLEFYENYDKVMQISGYMFPINSKNLPDTFFYTANTCWGWATWKRAWHYFIEDIDLILNIIEQQAISWKSFNAHQSNAFQIQLFENKHKSRDTWAVRWHASIIINNGTVLHPKVTLVKNVGFTGEGEHCKNGNSLGDNSFKENLDVSMAIDKSYDKIVENRLRKYFKFHYSILGKLQRRLKL